MAVRGRLIFAVLLTLGMLHSAAAKTYEVGGTGSNGGWTYQTVDSFYDDEFKNITLFVNDELTFTFTTGAHNVYEVTQEDLLKCDGSNPLKEYNSTITIPLTTAGFHGFLCEFPTHCTNSGMHLSVTVQSGSPAPATGGPSTGSPSAPWPGSPSAPWSPGGPPPGAASTIRSGPAMLVGAVLAGCAAMLF